MKKDFLDSLGINNVLPNAVKMQNLFTLSEIIALALFVTSHVCKHEATLLVLHYGA